MNAICTSVLSENSFINSGKSREGQAIWLPSEAGLIERLAGSTANAELQIEMISKNMACLNLFKSFPYLQLISCTWSIAPHINNQLNCRDKLLSSRLNQPISIYFERERKENGVRSNIPIFLNARF